MRKVGLIVIAALMMVGIFGVGCQGKVVAPVNNDVQLITQNQPEPVVGPDKEESVNIPEEQPVETEELKVADYYVRLFDGGLDFTARLDSTSTINGTVVYTYTIHIVVFKPANYKIKVETPKGQLIRETTIKDTYRGLSDVITHTSPECLVVITVQRDSKVEKIGLRPS